jgi:hypothetical protein
MGRLCKHIRGDARSAESDNSDTNCSGTKSGDEKELNLALIARAVDDPSPINIDEIIASKNTSDSKIIEPLRNIALSKKKELKPQ